MHSTLLLILVLWQRCCGFGQAFVLLDSSVCSHSLAVRPLVARKSSSSDSNNHNNNNDDDDEPNGQAWKDGANGKVSAQNNKEAIPQQQKDDDDSDQEAPSVWDCTYTPNANEERIATLKRDIFQMGASYNRGFAANPAARQVVLELVQELEEFNTQTGAATRVDGTDASASAATVAPLQGAWRLLWTTGPDVLVLDANPLVTTCAIYQVFEPPMVTNVIDLQPKVQALVPPGTIGNTLLRARVQTRANQRAGKPNRVGLVFERVQLQPLQLLGSNIEIFPPLGFDLPRFGSATSLPENADSPGYFDVTYLDDEVLVYRQQFNGLFVYIKVNDMDP